MCIRDSFDIENYSIQEQQHTSLGEAEYQLKYNLPKRLINKEDAHQYASLLSLIHIYGVIYYVKRKTKQTIHARI